MEQKKNKTNFLYTNFLGFLIKKGNKIKAKGVLDSALNSVSLQTKLSKPFIFVKIFSKLNTFVEIKKVQTRKRVNFIPFPIKFRRRAYLITKWFFESINEDSRKTAVSNKISTELVNILKNKSSKTELKKKQNLSGCIKNRSNIHYRW